jgi:DNA-3-methyladenine glycosylase I
MGGLTKAPRRCDWCIGDDLYEQYHDEVWGVPVYDRTTLFEFLTLEGAQAGLSWLTILRRQQGYRAAFDQFDISTVAAYDDVRRQALMEDTRIVRNRLKIDSTINNAQRILALEAAGTAFPDYLWSFVDGQPIDNRHRNLADVPASTPEAVKMSRDMKSRGFKFVGPTICYAFMQATGMVNDHLVGCFRHKQCAA